MIVSQPPKEPYQSAKHKRELAKAEATPIKVGVPGAASHGRGLLSRGPKDPADLTNAGVKAKQSKARAPKLPDGTAP